MGLAGAAAPPAASDATPVVTTPTESPEQLAVVPPLLSQTGLYADMATRAPGASVEMFAPAYQLWSDAAVKTRWVRLPPNTQIDTSDMDVWNVPVGTKLWKQFAHDGRLIETRYMAKFGPSEDDWVYIAYQWNDEQTDAVAVPDGVPNVNGSMHDIPAAHVCTQCHNAAPMATLGFSALQLAHPGPGLTVDALVSTGRMTVPPPGPLTLPGDDVTRNALGYLHANCGGCHNERATMNFGVTETKVVFWQSAIALGAVEQTTTYVNLVANTGGDLTRLQHGLDRMKIRDPITQMPPLGTELVDAQGVATVEAWLQRLQGELANAAAPATP